MRRGIEERCGSLIKPFKSVPGSMRVEFQMEHRHRASLILGQHLFDTTDWISSVEVLSHLNLWRDLSINHDTRRTLNENRPGVVPPRGGRITMGSCEGLYGNHIALLNSVDHHSLLGIEVDTLVDVILALDTKGTRMLT